jgi:hypothetical protein
MTNEEIEEEKAAGRRMLAQLIPFDEWLGLVPRLPGDVEMYFLCAHMVRHLAATGELPPRGSFGLHGPMAVSWACRKDEESFFRFGPDEPQINNAMDRGHE